DRRMRYFAVPRPRAARPLRWSTSSVVAATLALGLAALAIVVLGTHAGRTAVRTLLFLPEIFPGTPVRPLTWIAPAPRCGDLVIVYAELEAPADLCQPAGGGPHGGVVLTLGVHPLDRHDPFLVRLTEGLARMDLAVLRPSSPDLTVGHITTREVDGLV